MPNIIDSIQISSSTFDVRDKSATTVVNLTQEQYDNLPSSAKTANVLYNITDATAGDLSQYWTSAQTQSAITEATSGKADTSYVDQSVSGKVDITTFNTYSGNVETALSGKQDTLISGTNIKTINNESLLGSGNIDIQGGGGKAVAAGTNISITTGETADTINCTLPLSSSTSSNASKIILDKNYSFISDDAVISGKNDTIHASKSIVLGNNSLLGDGSGANIEYNLAFGSGNKVTASGVYKATASHNFIFGTNNNIYNASSCFALGYANNLKKSYQFVVGDNNTVLNENETLFGRYNVSSSASTTWGNSGNTLFSVGNGTSSARHNAFEIRQNGDIYLSLNGQDVKLQDQLGGGGGGITSGEVQSMIDESISGKTDESAFTAHTADTTIHVSSSEKNTWNNKSDFSGSYNDLTDKPTIPTSVSQLTNDSGYITNGDAQSQIDSSISGKADTSAVTQDIAAAVSGKLDTSTFEVYSGNVETALSGKQDTLSAGTNITIVDNVISAEGGGGKAVSGGTNISVTTGETADTINCTIPAFFHSNTVKGDINIGSNSGVDSDYGRLVIGRRVQSRGNPYFQYSIGIGVQPDNSNNYCQLYGQNSVGIGRGFKIGSDSYYSNGINDAIAIGHNATSRNNGGITLGANTTASGDSSVAIGSGATADGAEYKMNLNNQIKVTPSNQVYIYNKDNTEMICLQDQLGGGGGSSVVELTQAQYDALTTIDPDTIYVITDAAGGDLSNYYTKAQINAMIGNIESLLAAI